MEIYGIAVFSSLVDIQRRLSPACLFSVCVRVPYTLQIVKRKLSLPGRGQGYVCLDSVVTYVCTTRPMQGYCLHARQCKQAVTVIQRAVEKQTYCLEWHFTYACQPHRQRTCIEPINSRHCHGQGRPTTGGYRNYGPIRSINQSINQDLKGGTNIGCAPFQAGGRIYDILMAIKRLFCWGEGDRQSVWLKLTSQNTAITILFAIVINYHTVFSYLFV